MSIKQKRNKYTRKANKRSGGSGKFPKKSPDSPPTDYDSDDFDGSQALALVRPQPIRQPVLKLTHAQIRRLNRIHATMYKGRTIAASASSKKRSLASSLAHQVMHRFITGAHLSPHFDKLITSAELTKEKLIGNMVQTNYMPIIGGKGSEPGRFNRPQCIALDRDGNLVVADTENNRIQVINPFTGVCLRTIDRFRNPYHITFVFDETGITNELIVSDGNGVYLVNYVQGMRIRTIYLYGRLESSMVTSVVYDGAVQLRFRDKIMYYTTGGQNDPQNTVRVPGSGPMAYYTKNKTKRDEPIIVSDSDRGILYETAWGVVDTICNCGRGSGPGNFDGIGGIAVDFVGHIIVTDRGNNRLQIFKPKFTRVRSFGRPGKAYGEFAGPTSVVADRNGNIFVCDTGNHRIQVIRYDMMLFDSSW